MTQATAARDAEIRSGLNDFLQAFGDSLSPRRTLIIQASDFNLIDDSVAFPNTKVLSGSEGEVPNHSEAFDFVIGDLPYGMYKMPLATSDGDIKVPKNWIPIFQSARRLSDDGVGVFVLEPSGFGSKEGVKYLEALRAEGIHLNGYIQPPHTIFGRDEAAAPIIAILSRKQTESLLAIPSDSLELPGDVAQTIRQHLSGGSAAHYVLPESHAFRGFARFNARIAYEGLTRFQASYEEVALKDLCHSITLASQGATEDSPETLFLRRTQAFKSNRHRDKLNGLPNTWLSLTFRHSLHADYFQAFFSSSAGKNLLMSITDGFIPRLSIAAMNSLRVRIPPAGEMGTTVDLYRKFNQVEEITRAIKSELTINPLGSSDTQETLTQILDALGRLSEEEVVKRLIAQGESKTLEFKETVSLNRTTNAKDERITHAALKTVVAFLNTNGGTLLVGVNDGGDIVGIDREITMFYRNTDHFLLNWKNLIKEKIGEQFYPFIEYRILPIAHKQVLIVNCAPSTKPCFLMSSEFYIRTNPATDKIEGPKVLEYCETRFKERASSV